MLEVRIRYTVDMKDPGIKKSVYMSYTCPKCNMNIVSFRTLHKCYNCHKYVVSGGLLVNSAQYRLDYHTGRVASDGNIYEGAANAG